MGQVNSQSVAEPGPCHLAQLPAELLTREVYRHLDPVSQWYLARTGRWAHQLYRGTKPAPLTRAVALRQGAAGHVRRLTLAPYVLKMYEVVDIGTNRDITTLTEMLDICTLTLANATEYPAYTMFLFGALIETERDDLITEWCHRSVAMGQYIAVKIVKAGIEARYWFRAYLKRPGGGTPSPYLGLLVGLSRSALWPWQWLFCANDERSARRSIQLAAESKDVAEAIKQAFRVFDPRNVQDVDPWAYAMARAWSTPSTDVTRCVVRPGPVDILTLFTDPAELAAWFDMAGPGVLTNQEMLFALDMTPKALERGLLRVLRERGGLDYNAIPLLTLVQSFVRLEATFPLWVADLRATPPEKMTPKLHQLLCMCDVMKHDSTDYHCALESSCRRSRGKIPSLLACSVPSARVSKRSSNQVSVSC